MTWSTDPSGRSRGASVPWTHHLSEQGARPRWRTQAPPWARVACAPARAHPARPAGPPQPAGPSTPPSRKRQASCSVSSSAWTGTCGPPVSPALASGGASTVLSPMPSRCPRCSTLSGHSCSPLMTVRGPRGKQGSRCHPPTLPSLGPGCHILAGQGHSEATAPCCQVSARASLSPCPHLRGDEGSSLGQGASAGGGGLGASRCRSLSPEPGDAGPLPPPPPGRCEGLRLSFCPSDSFGANLAPEGTCKWLFVPHEKHASRPLRWFPEITSTGGPAAAAAAAPSTAGLARASGFRAPRPSPRAEPTQPTRPTSVSDTGTLQMAASVN